KNCPSCSQPLPTSLPACSNCWNIWSLPADTSYHEIFSLPKESNPFVIDANALKQKFRQMQATCHPDTWATQGQDKQDAAQALSSAVNHAYQTLLQPMPRIEYILTLNGNPLSETDTLEDESDKFLDFMMNIMMAREEIESAETREQVEPVLERNQEMMDETLKQIEGLVEEKKWPEVKRASVRLKYLDGIRKAA
ncbi:hypothetical protein BDP27DRAFT_1159541, partial [Rhodocollybia butyracea]